MFRCVLKATLFLSVILLWLFLNTSASQALIVIVDRVAFEGSNSILLGLMLVSCLTYGLLMAVLLVDVAVLHGDREQTPAKVFSQKKALPVRYHRYFSGNASNLEVPAPGPLRLSRGYRQAVVK